MELKTDFFLENLKYNQINQIQKNYQHYLNGFSI